MEDLTGTLRIAVLMLPVLAVLFLEIYRHYTPRARAAVLFSGLWIFLGMLALNIYGVSQNIIAVHISGAALHGVPVDMMLAVSFFAAFVGLLTQRIIPNVLLPLLFAGFIYHAPLLSLAADKDISVGSTALILVFLPAAVLLHATWHDTHIYIRTTLQSLIWVALLLWLFPSVAFVYGGGGGGGWQHVLSAPLYLHALYAVALCLPAGLVISALYVFARDGDGTGFPYDPPKRLVTRGIYKYMSNPMQTGICLALFLWGLYTQSLIVWLSAPLAFMLFIVFRDVCNGSANLCAQDPSWRDYQKTTPKWWPRPKTESRHTRPL